MFTVSKRIKCLCIQKIDGIYMALGTASGFIANDDKNKISDYAVIQLLL
jgi:hypothetical protein